MNCKYSLFEQIHARLTIFRLVFVHDPTDSGDSVIPVGKQTLNPSHIFYTPCSGIWQSVWLEPTPSNNWITQLDLDANMDGQGVYDVAGDLWTMLTHMNSQRDRPQRQRKRHICRGHGI